MNFEQDTRSQKIFVISVIYGALFAALIVVGVILFFSSSTETHAKPLSQSSNPIVVENQQSGTTDWQLTNAGNDINHHVKGYASETSVDNDGASTIDFHISVSSPQIVTIDIYRMGWYGGTGGRHMQQIAINGIVQPSPVLDPNTGLIVAPWSVSHVLTVPSTWTSGVYLAKLTNAGGWQNYIRFVVRDDNRNADFLYQNSDMNDQAYNRYPLDNVMGKNLYYGFGANTVTGTTRAAKVSFDRPYAEDGAGYFFLWEYYLIRWLEQNGYDVSYSSNVDTHSDGSRLLNYEGFFSTGHDEYWSTAMRDSVEAARDAGVDLAFFGSNAAYWHVRMEDAADGDPNRIMVCYKSSSIDPNPNPAEKTILFRALGRPEHELMGVGFIAYNSAHDPNALTDFIIQNDDHWLYANTGLTDGDSITSIVGYEADQADSSFGTPLDLNQSFKLMSASPFTDIRPHIGTITSHSMIYQAYSGAWVWASGTMSWSFALDKSGYIDSRAQQKTHNLLTEFLQPNTVTPVPTPTPTPTPALPGAATVLSPNGTITQNQPAFEWQDLGNATNYQLLVYDRDVPTIVHNTMHSAATVCSAGLCSVTPSGLVLNPNRHLWRVRASNSTGTGPWSTTLYFVVSASTPTDTPTPTATPTSSTSTTLPPTDTPTPTATPTSVPVGVVAQISPNGSISTTSPTFMWYSEPNASGYIIAVYDATNDAVIFMNSSPYSATAHCTGTTASDTCSVTPSLTLSLSTSYTWLIRAVDSGGGLGPWSTYP